MSNRKNYNSIVFLTTLSVYLGLVLVGAPPVLAQAALTQKIEIQNEAEIKDDLDKKPDDEIIGNINLANALIDFIKDLQTLQLNEQYNSEKDGHFYARRERFISLNSSSEITTSDKEFPSKLDEALTKVLGRLDSNELQSLPDFLSTEKNKAHKKISLEIYPYISGIKLLISFEKNSAQDASFLAESLNTQFFLKARRDDYSVKQIYINTQAVSTNNQVFIVTRLPRASIDEFPTKKVAQ